MYYGSDGTWVYMKGNQDIFEHKPPQDSSWYWRKLNAIKKDMVKWYEQGVYVLTINGKYSRYQATTHCLGCKGRLELLNSSGTKFLNKGMDS